MKFHRRIELKNRHGQGVSFTLMAGGAELDDYILIDGDGLTISFHFGQLRELAELFQDAVKISAEKTPGGAP